MRSKHSILTRFCAFIALIFLIICTLETIRFVKFINTPLITGPQSVDFILRQGTSVKRLAKELHALNLISHPHYFIFLARIQGKTHQFQAGEYRITPGTTPEQLLQHMIAGKVILHAFTIIPGWTFKEMMRTLNNTPHLTHLFTGLSDDMIMKKINHEGEMPEGRFYPETYLFSSGVRDVDILRNAYELMQQHLNEAWENRANNIPYDCPYKALIAASIIEKETAIPEERSIISGVIVRRLALNMPLQMDPTVIYGLGDNFKGDLEPNDLKIDTSYNTYLHKGLPLTPISMPSDASLYAAMHPDNSNFVYFVVKGDGHHEFSITLENHNKAVAIYRTLKKKMKNNIKNNVEKTKNAQE